MFLNIFKQAAKLARGRGWEFRLCETGRRRSPRRNDVSEHTGWTRS